MLRSPINRKKLWCTEQVRCAGQISSRALLFCGGLVLILQLLALLYSLQSKELEATENRVIQQGIVVTAILSIALPFTAMMSCCRRFYTEKGRAQIRKVQKELGCTLFLATYTVSCFLLLYYSSWEIAQRAGSAGQMHHYLLLHFTLQFLSFSLLSVLEPPNSSFQYLFSLQLQCKVYLYIIFFIAVSTSLYYALELPLLQMVWLAFSGFFYLLVSCFSRFLLYQIQNTRIELTQAKEAVMQYASVNLDLLQKNEKNSQKLSQEIHDSVGHVLTGSLMQSRNIAKLLRCQQYEKALEITDEQTAYLQFAIQDVRSLLHKTHMGYSPQYNWVELWKLLCKAFSDATGAEIKLQLLNELESEEGLQLLGDAVAEALYRSFQECFTNSIRHGYATYIEVSFRLQKGKFLILISDNGIGAPKYFNYGVGLEAMRERIKAIGGELAVNTLPSKGFDLGISFKYPTRG